MKNKITIESTLPLQLCLYISVKLCFTESNELTAPSTKLIYTETFLYSIVLSLDVIKNPSPEMLIHSQ